MRHLYRVEGAVRQVSGVNEEFISPAHNVVLKGVALSQADVRDCSDPGIEKDVVQSSNGSKRTAPPEESATGHAVHSGEGAATPSYYSPYEWVTIVKRVMPRLFNTAHLHMTIVRNYNQM